MQAMIYGNCGIVLVGISILGLLLNNNIIKKILALNLSGVGIFMLLVSSAKNGPTFDAVPHAMVLTGIVVAVAGTALALTLNIDIIELNNKVGTESSVE